jgi:enoyl-CoA hydratase
MLCLKQHFRFCNGIAQKIIKNSPVAISKAIKAVNANFKDGKTAMKPK